MHDGPGRVDIIHGRRTTTFQYGKGETLTANLFINIDSVSFSGTQEPR